MKQEKLQIKEQTLRWLRDIVIALNFCPFAKKELLRDTIRLQVCSMHDIGKMLEQLVGQMLFLQENNDIETTLLIYPDQFSDFEEFLDFVDMAQQILQMQGMEGVFQLATFHPDYCFEGVPQDDPGNYTNRSPYPMVHILREAAVEAAIEHYPNPEQIPERNVKTAHSLGIEQLKLLLENCFKA